MGEPNEKAVFAGDLSPTAVILLDGEGRIESWPPDAERIFGYSSREAAGALASDLIVPKHHEPRFRAAMDTFTKAGAESLEGKVVEFAARREDGWMFPAEWFFCPIRTDGSILVSVVVRDISRRVLAFRELDRLARRQQLSLNAARLGWWHYDPMTKIAAYDERYKEIFGVAGHERPNEEILKLLHPDDLSHVWAAVEAALDPVDPKPYRVRYRITRPDGALRWVEAHGMAEFDGEGVDRRATDFVGTVADITERYNEEARRRTMLELLQLLAEVRDTRETIRDVVQFLHRWSGCEAVGIRLKDGEDYPYFETSGFPEEFVERERHLCAYDEAGEVQRDADGNPCLDCMCGNIIQGRFDPAKSFFTVDGCFWSNCTTELLATTTDAERQARTRNRCNSFGYESVALVPLRSGDRTLGLLQFNDRRANRFSEESVALLRWVADYFAHFLARKLAEDELRVQRERMEAIFASTQEAVFSLDEESRVLTWNPAAERIFGWRADEVLGRVNPIVPPDQWAEHLELRRRILAGESFDRLEATRMTKDGRTIHLMLSTAPLRDRFGATIGLLAIALDLSERRRMEADVFRLNARLERLIRVVQDLSRARSVEGIQDIVRHAARDLGDADGATFVLRDGDQCWYVDEDAIEPLWKGRRFPMTHCISGWSMLHKQAAAIEDIYVDDRIPHDAYRPTFVKSLVMTPIRSDDPIGAIGCYWARPYKATGEDLRLFQALADTTSVALENVRTMEELADSRRRYRDLVENVDDVVWSVDVEGRFVYMSPSISHYGFRPEEFVGRHFREFAYEDDLSSIEKAFAATKEGTPAVIECRIYDKEGGIRHVRVSARVQTQNGRPEGVTGILIDLTDQRTLEHQFHQAQKLESVGRLAGGVAHDFNNMLTAIQGFSEIILDSLQENDPIRPSVQEILNAAESAASLTRQLLAFSRKQIVSPRVVDLNKAVGRSEKMLRRLIGEDIDFVFVPRENAARVSIDPGQVDQILVNLAVNSRDAMPGGGKLTFETMNVTLDEKRCRSCGNPIVGEFVLLAVSDNGSGIDEETLEQIFEPFFTTKAKGEGTGLGLSTVHGIVHQAKGHINVYSEPGRGTSFKIYLPAVREDTEAEREADKRVVSTGGSETILLVEDQELVRRLTAKVLRAHGYTVIEARQGGEALDIYRKLDGKIDLLITDVVMPGMSGRELHGHLTESAPDLKVLYMSGYTENAIAHHGVLDKGIQFIQKPFRPQELATKVRSVLDL